MKRTDMLWISLVLCLALIIFSGVSPAVADIKPTTDPISGLTSGGRNSAPPNFPTSTDSTSWTKHPSNPVLNIGAAGSWDSKEVSVPSVLVINGTYYMWYSGRTTLNSSIQIGLATSPDGVTWTKYQSNPVLTVGLPGAWDSGYVMAPHVIYQSSTYKMWYRGSNDPSLSLGASIGYATSTDGVTWIKHPGNPVLTVGASGAWDDYQLSSGYVIVDGGIYKMWFSGSDGTNFRIGYATSPDGFNWTKHAGNPVFNLSPAGSWDSSTVYYPNIFFNGNNYEMWFSGHNGSVFSIGYATSMDGISWSKYSGNPVLTKGTMGSWESAYVIATSVISQGGDYQMWYSGSDGTLGRIGLATSILPTDRIYLPSVLR